MTAELPKNIIETGEYVQPKFPDESEAILFYAYEDLYAHAATLQKQLEEARELLRETVMRSNLLMPENEQDDEWFEQKLKLPRDKELMEKLFAFLELGTHFSRTSPAEGGKG